MSLDIHTSTDTTKPAQFIASAIVDKLTSGKKVLFFATGGSSIAVGLIVAELLQKELIGNENLLENLTVTLTDERYGSVGHADSNRHQLLEQGFNIPRAKLIPVLTGDDRARTTAKFNAIVEEELKKAEYKVGMFGIGKDGHTAGILPGSVALESKDFACAYDTADFSRITITPKVIQQLDEVVVYAQGKDKWSVLEGLEKDIDITTQPAQLLKQVPLVTIFTDYKKNESNK